MAKRKRRARRRAAKMTIPIAPMIGLISMPAMRKSVQTTIQGNWIGTLHNLSEIVGIDYNGNFSGDLLKTNMFPLIVGVGVHKLAGIAGINRILGAAKVPFVRV